MGMYHPKDTDQNRLFACSGTACYPMACLIREGMSSSPLFLLRSILVASRNPALKTPDSPNTSKREILLLWTLHLHLLIAFMLS